MVSNSYVIARFYKGPSFRKQKMAESITETASYKASLSVLDAIRKKAKSDGLRCKYGPWGLLVELTEGDVVYRAY